MKTTILVFAVMNNYQAAAAAAAQGFGPPASPHATNAARQFPSANSPGPTIDMYSSSGPGDSVGYVQAASPQPSGFPTIAVSRAPLNYSPVSISASILFWYKLFQYNILIDLFIDLIGGNLPKCLNLLFLLENYYLFFTLLRYSIFW